MKTEYNDINFILDNVHDHVVITDTQGIIQYANNSFLKSSGYTVEEVVGRNMNILKSGFHSQKFYKKFWDTISSGNKYIGTFKNKRKNGDFFWVKKTVTSLLKDGAFIGYLSISSDITGYKAFETKLKEEHEFTNTIINTSQALITVLNKEGVLVSINDACVNLSGFTKEELIGKEFGSLINMGVLSDKDNPFIKNVNQRDIAHSFVLPLKTKHGITHLIKWSNSVIRNDENSIRYIISNGIDITDEHNYKEELQSLNENLQSLVYKRTEDLEDLTIELISSQNRLKEAQRISNIGNWDWDILTGDLFWSDEIYRIFELENKGFIPTYLKFLERVHPDDMYMVKDGVDLAFKKIKKCDVEHRIITPNNTIKYIQERGEVYFNEEGLPIRMIGTVQDITKQKEIDIKLRQNEARLAEAQRIAQMGYWSWNPNNNELYWSDEVYRIFEVDSNHFELNYINYVSKIHPADIELVENSIKKILTDKINYDIIHRIILSNNEIKYIRCKSEFELLSNGNINKVIGTIHNVTERIKYEQTIIESEKKYRDLYENATVGIFKTNITTQKAVEANNVCIELFGYDSKENFLLNFKASDHYFLKEKREFIITEMPKRGTMSDVEMKFKKCNGDVFWGKISARHIAGTDEIEGVVVDITKRVLFEEELQKALHEKELLLKEVHHRVKNNLQIVSGLLLLQINKISDPKVLAPLLESRDRIETISLVHEKLYQTTNLSHISFKDYLEELCVILLQTYSEKRIEIQLEINDILLNIGTAIPMGLIFHELVSNSLKHGFLTYNTSSKISIEITNSNENTLLVKYIDNGSGCDESKLVNSNSLGMKLVNALVKELAGTLQVQTMPNNGIEISFNAQKK